MSEQALESKFSKFLSIQTGFFGELLEQLPSFQHYSLLKGGSDESMNIYEFTDYICDHRPADMTRIELSYGTVSFCSSTLNWEVLDGVEDSDLKIELEQLAKLLNTVYANATLVRNWEKAKEIGNVKTTR